MFKSAKSKVIALGASAVVLATNAAAAVTVPTTSYTDVEAMAGVAIGITVVVLLINKAKSFFR